MARWQDVKEGKAGCGISRYCNHPWRDQLSRRETPWAMILPSLKKFGPYRGPRVGWASSGSELQFPGSGWNSCHAGLNSEEVLEARDLAWAQTAEKLGQWLKDDASR